MLHLFHCPFCHRVASTHWTSALNNEAYYWFFCHFIRSYTRKSAPPKMGMQTFPNLHAKYLIFLRLESIQEDTIHLSGSCVVSSVYETAFHPAKQSPSRDFLVYYQ